MQRSIWFYVLCPFTSLNNHLFFLPLHTSWPEMGWESFPLCFLPSGAASSAPLHSIVSPAHFTSLLRTSPFPLPLTPQLLLLISLTALLDSAKPFGNQGLHDGCSTKYQLGLLTVTQECITIKIIGTVRASKGCRISWVFLLKRLKRRAVHFLVALWMLNTYVNSRTLGNATDQKGSGPGKPALIQAWSQAVLHNYHIQLGSGLSFPVKLWEKLQRGWRMEPSFCIISSRCMNCKGEFSGRTIT